MADRRRRAPPRREEARGPETPPVTPSSAAPRAAGRPRRRPATFAFAQPLFDLLGRNAEITRVAFDFVLPAASLPERGGEERVQVFALAAGRAAELAYAPGYPWQTG